MSALRRFLLLAAAAALAAVATLAAGAQTPETPPPSDPPPAPETPEGVTVLTPGWVPLPNIDDFPEGVTVLGTPPAPADGVPRVVVRNLAVAEEPERAGFVPRPPPLPRGELIRPRHTGGAAARSLSRTIGPSVDEQLRAFGRPAVPAGAPILPESRWRPVPAWPPREGERPYPWNPATFAKPILDPVFTPENAWEGSYEVPPWARVTWLGASFAEPWEPQDAWGRSLGFPEPEPEEAAASEAMPGAPSAADATPSTK